MALGVGSFAYSVAQTLKENGADVCTYLTRNYGHFPPSLAGPTYLAERALRDCLQLRPEDSAPNLQLGMALLLRDTALATSEEALRCFELAGEGQRRTGRDMGLAILYQATALKRLGRLDEARRRADAYLASPGVTADATIATRIRELLDG